MRITTLFTLILSLLIVGCNKSSTSEKIINSKPENEMKPVIDYLALGDSYTIGESVDTSERWPVQLVDRLRSNSVTINDPVIIARTGWTTDELISGIESSDITGTFDLVSLLIGVNNQYRGRDIENFRKELLELFNITLTYSGNQPEKVIILSIPDWGVTPFARGRDQEMIGDEIDRFNMVVKEESQRAGFTYFDITEISRLAATNPELIAPDGLHPSGRMYSLWVELVLKSDLLTQLKSL